MDPRTFTPCIARPMRMRNGFLVAVLLAAWSPFCQAMPSARAHFCKADLGGPFLLQVNYSEADGGLKTFMTSRSRIVRFERAGGTLRMLDDSYESRRVLAVIPIQGETDRALDLDLNAAFDEIDIDEDRTGEDYYGRVEKHAGMLFRLLDREVVSVSYHEQLLVFDQSAKKENGDSLIVHYYLSPYRPDPDFDAFEMKSLDHFGFYETYPRQRLGRWVLYATKFDAHEPIVFALSATIPARYRDAVRDGVLYWNRALGTPLLRVVDAPSDVRAPSPDYNVIEWVGSGEYASTSYIQSDPLTGQILHAHVFVLRETMMDGDLEHQNSHLRYIVAHEIGHALGLRHNFAPGRVTTVMDYFNLTQIFKLGRDIGAGKPALPYDRQVIRHVYLGAPLEVDGLPPFCTDDQKGCSPFPAPRESLGIKGDSAGETRMPED